VALAEAKRQRRNVSSAIDQAERYSKGFVPSADISVPGGVGRVPGAVRVFG